MEFEIYEKTLYSYLNLDLKQDQAPYKLACFDLDSTLIRTSSGAKFPKSSDDWEWSWLTVPKILNNLSEQGYIICIFTNQKGIKTGKTTPQELVSKLNKIQSGLPLGVKFSVILAAGDDDFYRKPRTGMWRFLQIKHPELTDNIDYVNSFYCGDAAGRLKNWTQGKPKDFSYSDLYFAENLKMPFKLPESLFEPGYDKLDIVTLRTTYKLQPDQYLEKGGLLDWVLYNDSTKQVQLKIPSDPLRPELVIMVGPPASGKTSLVQKYIQAGYVHVNMDTLRTKKKCLDLCRYSVMAGRNVIIDNTNPAKDTRKEYLELTKNQAHKYYLKAYVMRTPTLVCKHLNNLRVQKTEGDARRIPQVAYNMYKKNFQDVSQSLEGFDQVIEVPFCIDLDKIEPEFMYKYDL